MGPRRTCGHRAQQSVSLAPLSHNPTTAATPEAQFQPCHGTGPRRAANERATTSCAGQRASHDAPEATWWKTGAAAAGPNREQPMSRRQRPAAANARSTACVRTRTTSDRARRTPVSQTKSARTALDPNRNGQEEFCYRGHALEPSWPHALISLDVTPLISV